MGGVPAALRPGDAVLPGSHICGFHRVFGERKPRHPAQSCLCTQCVRKSRPLSCALRDRRCARSQRNLPVFFHSSSLRKDARIRDAQPQRLTSEEAPPKRLSPPWWTLKRCTDG